MKNPLQCKTKQRVRRLPTRCSRGLSGNSRILRTRDALILWVRQMVIRAVSSRRDRLDRIRLMPQNEAGWANTRPASTF
jgi:hypothetical protein